MNATRFVRLGMYIIRLLVGLTFLASGIVKLREPITFAIAVDNFRILPHGVVLPAAHLVSSFEVCLGLCLLLGIWLDTVALCLAGCSTVFLVALASAMWRGLDISCGCFGGTVDPIGWQHVGRGILLLAAAVLLYTQPCKWKATLGRHTRRLR